MPPGDQIMWKAIRAAMRALTDALSRTTSFLAHGVAGAGDWMLDIWNSWSRAISGTGYRPPRVTEAEDHVDAIVERAPEPVTPIDDMADRGRQVRSAATRILCGDRSAGMDLPTDVRLWLLALAKPDLRLLLEATDDQIGRHASGQSCIKMSNGRPVPVPEVERDLSAIKRREADLSRGLSMQEKAHLEEVLGYKATKAVEDGIENDLAEEPVAAPRLVP